LPPHAANIIPQSSNPTNMPVDRNLNTSQPHIPHSINAF
jgi:hypothetical protein